MVKVQNLSWSWKLHKMAFMGEDSWKSGLSAAQIAKISTLENQRDGFKSELAKKAYNFDILQQNLEKEKRKVSHDNTGCSSFSKLVETPCNKSFNHCFDNVMTVTVLVLVSKQVPIWRMKIKCMNGGCHPKSKHLWKRMSFPLLRFKKCDKNRV